MIDLEFYSQRFKTVSIEIVSFTKSDSIAYIYWNPTSNSVLSITASWRTKVRDVGILIWNFRWKKWLQAKMVRFISSVMYLVCVRACARSCVVSFRRFWRRLCCGAATFVMLCQGRMQRKREESLQDFNWSAGDAPARVCVLLLFFIIWLDSERKKLLNLRGLFSLRQQWLLVPSATRKQIPMYSVSYRKLLFVGHENV